MVIAYVGSGGKTTLIRRHAEELRRQGMKVLVTTTTHMYIEEDTLLTSDAQEIIRELDRRGYAMAGTACGEKIAALPEKVYLAVCEYADAVLVEADGSKHMPLKFPAAHEPVIPANADEIIVVCGLHGLGKAAKDACHRLEPVKNCLGIDDETVITVEHIIKLLREGYVYPLRRKYPETQIIVHPAHDHSPEQLAAAQRIIDACMKT